MSRCALLAVLLVSTSLHADVGDSWNVREGFVEGLDQFIETADPWSYRCGEPGRPDYGQLLIWKESGQWGSGPTYTRALEIEDRPLLSARAEFTNPAVDDPNDEQVGGHGAYMLRFTSPSDGWMQVTGYVYQTPSPQRLVNWQLLHNDTLMTEGFTPFEAETLSGYENRVSFDSGRRGLQGTFVFVEEGDTIDLITAGSCHLGDSIPVGVNTALTITQVDEEDVPDANAWDARADFVPALDQEFEPNGPWSYRHGDPNRDDYEELLMWRDAGQWGQPASYTKFAFPEDGEDSPLLGAGGYFGSRDCLNQEIGGHGAWMIRWESPIAGLIKINGYIYQAEQDCPAKDCRVTNWQLLKNGDVLTQGFTANDGVRTLNGYENRVSFENGSGGLRGTFVEVDVGDEIDFITPGNEKFGSAIATSIQSNYVIRTASEDEVPEAPDTWDARLDFAADSNPNGDWSYRDGSAGGNYGSVMPWDGAAYASGGGPFLAGSAQFGGADPSLEQIGGQGSFLLRWTSPIDGWVGFDGYLYQPEAGSRLTQWQLLKNDAMFTQGSAAFDGDGPLSGFESRVGFDSGSRGARGTFVEVAAGDRLDLITPGSNQFGDSAPTGVNTVVRLTEVPAPPTGVNAEPNPNGNGVKISWTAAPDTARVSISGYNVFQNSPGETTQLNSEIITGTALAVAGLAGNVEFCFQVESVGSNGRASQPSESCATTTQDQRTEWDVRTDFVEGLDQNAEPNLPWTYRSGEIGTPAFGKLLVWKEAGQWGTGPVYTRSVVAEERPIVGGTPQFIADPLIEDVDDEQFGGHGSWLIRWTSPIDGLVQVTGYVYQSPSIMRLMNWQIRKNGATFTQGFTPFDEFGSLSGFDNRVAFEDGSGGLRRTFFEVRVGDTIDFLTPGDGRFGDPIPPAGNAVFRIRIADPTEVPVQANWDVRRDFISGLNQESDPNRPWTYHDGEPDAGRYGNLLVWKDQPQWGQGPSYTRSATIEDRPMLLGQAAFGGEDPELEQIGGHGAWLVRWTAPFTGQIVIDGYVYVPGFAGDPCNPADCRLLSWAFLHNDLTFTAGLTAHDDIAPINGYDDRTFFVDGDGGEGALTVDVEEGDFIDLVAQASNEFGSNIPPALNAKLTIERAGEQPGVGPFIRGDCDGNRQVGGSPTEAIVLLNFAFRGGDAPACLAACDAEANGSIGVTDALRILRHSFLGIGEPDAPFPKCTTSELESDVSLGCATPPGCP